MIVKRDLSKVLYLNHLLINFYLMRKTCGLDVHKDTIFCAIYNGEEYSPVKEYSPLTPDIQEMGEYLLSEDVSEIAMESTGKFWISIWNILEAMGFELMLVNGYHVKQIPGRKSDVKDAQWIAKLLHKDLLRGSLVPPPEIRELRTYSRQRVRLVRERVRCDQHMEDILIQCGIRLSNCISTLNSVSRYKVIDALIDGITDPIALEKLVMGNRDNKASGKLRKALTGCMTEHHRLMLCMDRDTYNLKSQQIEKCESLMKGICDEHFALECALLQTVPGIQMVTAMTIIAETGGESSVRCKNTFFQYKFGQLCKRKSRKKALIAIARKILVVVWHILSTKKPYNPRLTPILDPIKIESQIKHYQRKLEKAQKLLSC
jgi:transposase